MKYEEVGYWLTALLKQHEFGWLHCKQIHVLLLCSVLFLDKLTAQVFNHSQELCCLKNIKKKKYQPVLKSQDGLGDDL